MTKRGQVKLHIDRFSEMMDISEKKMMDISENHLG